MKENKISIEITADGWKTDVTINGKTYSERHIGHYGSSECVEGNFEEDDEIPESIYDALNDFFCSRLPIWAEKHTDSRSKRISVPRQE